MGEEMANPPVKKKRAKKGPPKKIYPGTEGMRPGQAAAIMRLPERYRLFALGEIKLDELDIEELRRGQIRDINGNFTGRPPTNLPLKFYRAMTEEYIRRVEQENLIAVQESYDTLRQVMRQPGVPGDAKVKAATQLLDRLAGPVGTKVELSGMVKQTWEVLMEGGAVAIDLDQPQIENIVDAEIVDE